MALTEEQRQALGIDTPMAADDMEAPAPVEAAPSASVVPPIAPSAPTSTIAPSMTAPPAPAGGEVAPAIGSTEDLENRGAASHVMQAAGPSDPQAAYKKQLADAKNDTLNTKIGSPEYYQARQRELDLKKDNPWGSAGNHPGIAGKILHGLGVAGNIAGDIFAPGTMALIPGTELHNRVETAQNEEGIAQGVENNLKTAQTKTAQAKEIKTPWKPMSGEQFTHYDATTGRPDRQLYTNDETGEQQWRPLPSDATPVTGAPAPGGTPAIGAAPAAAAPAPAGYYGNKEMPKFDEKPVGDNVGQYKSQIDSATLRVPKGYDVAAPEITASDTNATAKEKIKDYHTAVNNAILADRADKAQAARETAAETKDRRAEERANRKVTGYAENSDGQIILTNKFDAGNNGQAFEEIKPGDVNKDRAAMRQLNDVQKNVNLYAKSIREDLKNLKPGDTDKMREIMTLNQQGGGSVIDIGAKGVTLGSIPVIGAKLTKLNLKQMSDDLADLSPAARNMLTGYLRTAAAVPAYQKALTGIGRSNKEMLDLEIANIPLPYFDSETSVNRMKAFQDNVHQARAGFPSNLPGMKLLPEESSDSVSGGGHSFTINGKQYESVPDDVYQKYKGQPGFKE